MGVGGGLSQVVLLVEEVGKACRREPQGEGDSPSCILPVFIEHLLCASPQSLFWVLPEGALGEEAWICFHKSSLLHCRLSPGYLRGPIGVCLLHQGWQLQPPLQ